MALPNDVVGPLRVLILGGSGMLGSDVVREFADNRCFVSSPIHSDLDVTWAQHLEKLRQRDYGDFDWVVNCAAYTAVDAAEGDAMAAMKLNFVAPGMVAAVCAENGWRMVHVSTDFVFDGTKAGLYVETDQVNPLGIYGRSKLQGEQAVAEECPSAVIVRTSWLFGPKGKSFPRTMIEAWSADKPLRVVADQTGTPSYTRDMARILRSIVSAGVAPGTYHAAGPEAMSWHDFAVRAIEAYKSTIDDPRPVLVEPVTAEEWPTPARRPANSALSMAKLEGLGIGPMPNVNEALADFSKRLVTG